MKIGRPRNPIYTYNTFFVGKTLGLTGRQMGRYLNIDISELYRRARENKIPFSHKNRADAVKTDTRSISLPITSPARLAALRRLAPYDSISRSALKFALTGQKEEELEADNEGDENFE